MSVIQQGFPQLAPTEHEIYKPTNVGNMMFSSLLLYWKQCHPSFSTALSPVL